MAEFIFNKLVNIKKNENDIVVFFVLLLLLLITPKIQGQADALFSTDIQKTEGEYSQGFLFAPAEGQQQLNEEQIRNIVQLQDGRLGVFTEGMLNLYDGAGFKTIHIDDGYTTAITGYTGFHHSYVENNRVWFKNKGRLAVINLSKENCEKHPLKVLQNLGFTGTPTDLFVDTDMGIWVVTSQNKLLCYSQVSKKVTTFVHDVTNPDNNLDALYDIVTLNNMVYLCYKSGLLRCYNRLSGKEVYKLSTINNRPDDYTDWLHVTPVQKYLYFVRAGFCKGKLIRYDTETHKSTLLLETKKYWLNSLAANKDGDLFMSCREGFWYFKAGEKNGAFYPELNITGGHKIKIEISTLLYDRQGGLWAGTLNKGLYYYHPDRFLFQCLGKRFFGLSDLAELQVNCFEETINRQLLVGTNNGLFTSTLPLKKNLTFKLILPNVYCNAVYKDKTGNIWVSTSQGLYMINTDGTFNKYLNDAVHYVYQTQTGKLYACTQENGLLLWDKTTKSFKNSYPGETLPQIKFLTEWKDNLFGLCAKGPFVIDENGIVNLPFEKGYKQYPMFRHNNHRYSCLFPDSDGDLWLGTYDGLTLWNEKKQKLYQLNTDDGLVNNSIKAIIEDTDHSFWVTTSRGISHIFKTCKDNTCSFKIINYNNNTGVLEHTFSERSVFLSSQSTLFAGGVDGMNVFPKDKYSTNKSSLSPVWLNLKLFGKNVVEGRDYKGNVVLNKSMSVTDTLLLNYNQNFFSISFSGLNYTNPTQTYYRYMLEGVDDDWRIDNPISGIGEAGYTNISPGEYTFKLQASPDGSNLWGTPKKLSIIINPPFWKTTYAKLFYVIFILLLIWFITVQIVRHNRKIRQKKYTEAIETAKSDFITNMSHELRTPLTLIITPLRSLIAKVSDKKIKTDLQQISNNANLLLDTVNQLLDFKKIDSGNELLHRHFYDNLYFIEEICDAYCKVSAEKEINFISEIQRGEVHIHIDRQKVTRIIINLLSNAFKFTPAGGNVFISATINEKNQELNIIVKDNGKGIAEGETEKIFDRFYQATNQNETTGGSGIGLYMVKQYAELHGGNVTVSSVLGEGTTFNLKLSVKEEDEEIPLDVDNENDKKTVLIVEDHKTFSKYLCDELMPHYNVITAQNGKIGLEKAQKLRPDIVITDMMMPVMNGQDFCKALRNNVIISHTPVLMLTGKTSEEAHFEGYESGVDAYLEKPFDIKLLLLRISKLLEISEARQNAFIKEKDIKTELITSNPLDRAILERALDFVEKNISNANYSIEKFSADMGMERTGLYRKLLALTGQSPTNFIRAVRLKKAATILSGTLKPVADIAEEVGFNSVSYFSKCFHESFGSTPSQYREETTIFKE
ncbi:hybrid sensor histidine kinase/response regulator transcription factor [Flavobacterium rhizosphaerae]|uniref:histidine kinase n=1 Tax=Flavobacterium rhizosphaerae TaxID=3163298 RepID=A0ABW8YWK6_9FLAO